MQIRNVIGLCVLTWEVLVSLKKNAEKIDKLDFIKIKNFSASNKEHFKKTKPTKGRKC